MPAINNVVLMGRLTADPELKQTQSGVNVCRFVIAIDRRYTQEKGDRQSDFITVVAWRQAAEFISRNFSKGKLIIVEGELRSGGYPDRNHSDVTHYTTEVYADRVGFGETKAAQQAGGSAPPVPDPSQQPAQSRQSQPTQATPSHNSLDMSDFEEVIGYTDLPF